MSGGGGRRGFSIRTRIFGGFLGLLGVVFALVTVSYNLVVDSYITREVKRQLGSAVDYVYSDVLNPSRERKRAMAGGQGKQDGPSKQPTAPEQPDLPDLMPQIADAARKATFVTQVQLLAVDEQGALVYIKQDGLDVGQAEGVLTAFQRHGLDFQSGAIQRVDADGQTYFAVVQRMASDEPGLDEPLSGTRLLLYLNMTDIAQLAGALNRVLVLVILGTSLIASVLALFLSGRITRPIRAISDFAAAIGRNDFSRRDIAASDRELVELLATMNHTAEQLDRYDTEQKTFFQNASHELRTPLMSIKGYAEGIRVGVFDDDKQAAGVIISESDRLTGMVEDLLYLSKLDNITAPDALSPIDLRELLSNCTEGLRGVALHEGVEIVYDFADDPVMVSAGESALSRALVNVLSNAMRYARSRVTVRCKAENGRAVASIEDDGGGIDEHDIPKLFNRFYKGRGGKHGIGLSIARAVVQQHGGSIRAQNTSSGAEFTVELPLGEGEGGR